jgi:hypothetical protein
MLLKKLIPAFFLVFLCCTTGVAMKYKDQRFVRNPGVQKALAKCWEQHEYCALHSPLAAYDRAMWGIFAKANTQEVKRIGVTVPNIDEKGKYCGEFYLRVVPNEKMSVSECIKLFCYDSAFDESKFVIEFCIYAAFSPQSFPKQFLERKGLSEDTPKRIPVIRRYGHWEDDSYYENLHYFEVVPGEKALLQVKYEDY